MLELYMHPLASYCWKALLALYETGIPFTPHVIDLADPAQRAELVVLWPLARFPVLRDHGRGQVIPESSIIVEYLARHYPEAAHLVPDDLDVRARDRFFDLYVQEPLGRMVRDMLAPGDPAVVVAAREMLATAYRLVETMPERTDFTFADRLLARPSMFRVRREAEPYWHNFPGARLRAGGTSSR